MRIQVNDTFKATLQGRERSIDVQVSFDGDATELAAVLAAVARQLGPEAAQVDVPPEAKPADAPEKPPKWEKPDLHAKAMKSVHRVVVAVAAAGGKGLTVQELVKRARISTVPAYKMLKDDHPQGAYAARFLRTTKIGRSQVVDLTREGHHLASLIRAGKVPS
jgi:hypothetical protein